MKIPYFQATIKNSDRKIQGFYFEYPETTYCFSSDYEREGKPVKLIPCIAGHRMTDWGLPNEPVCYQIEKETLEQIGWVDTQEAHYFPKFWIKEGKG